MALDDAKMAHEQAELAKNQSIRIRIELQELILAISEFLEQHGARPEDIRQVRTAKHTYCLAMLLFISLNE